MPGPLRAAESSWLLRLYRRVVPVAVRREIVARTSARTRTGAKRSLAMVPSARHLLGRAQAHRLVRRYPRLSTGEDRAVRMVRGAAKIVLVRSDVTALAARNANEALVRQTLDAAGIDHFCVRGRNHSSAVVAVPEKHRGAALRALADRCGAVPGYVGVGGRRSATRPGFTRAVWRTAGRCDVIRLTWYHSDPTGQLILGPKYGCDVEFWSADDTMLVAPRPNRTADRVPLGDTPVSVSDSLFTGLASPAHPLVPVRTRREFALPGPEDVRFPVDAVYTWVDGSDTRNGSAVVRPARGTPITRSPRTPPVTSAGTSCAIRCARCGSTLPGCGPST
ncbi:Stealth CR1 domain-containing protein [Streptomyces sp. SYP-A7185]|uniref:Stealth CR1 domain-containing protein n=1 Tax=Streptomyces sp. SYP-A7185 TaxID=3040076 RepID=UPI0038F6F6ED